MTANNPPARIDHDTFAVSRTIHISASVEKVWAAVTEPEHIARWHTSHATLTALEPGGTGVWTFDGYGDAPVRVEEIDAPHSITYRWGTEGDAQIFEGRSTVFTFTLTPADGGTELTVVETGFDVLPDPARGMRDNQAGWTEQLDKLVAYVEAGA